MSNRVMTIIGHTSMAYAHKTLKLIAKRNGIDPDTFRPGEFVLFVNGPLNACKLLGANNVLLYYRHPKNHSLDLRALRLIPDFIRGNQIQYDDATRRSLKMQYPQILEFRGD